jgi:hypothetical protein
MGDRMAMPQRITAIPQISGHIVGASRAVQQTFATE